MIIVKTFIATLGWTKWPVASLILRHGLSKGDKIVLLSQEEKDGGSREGIKEVKGFVSKFAPGVEVLDVPVAVHDPTAAIAKLARLMRGEDERGAELILNLSGGTRALVIEAILALTLLQVKGLTVELRTEDEVDIRIPKVWGSFAGLSPKEERALRAFGRSPLSLGDLAKALGVSMATAHRLSGRLEKLGAIASKKAGKERRMELTEMGRMMRLALELTPPPARRSASALSASSPSVRRR